MRAYPQAPLRRRLFRQGRDVVRSRLLHHDHVVADISAAEGHAGVPLRLEDILADYSGWEEMFRKIAYKEEYL